MTVPVRDLFAVDHGLAAAPESNGGEILALAVFATLTSAGGRAAIHRRHGGPSFPAQRRAASTRRAAASEPPPARDSRRRANRSEKPPEAMQGFGGFSTRRAGAHRATPVRKADCARYVLPRIAPPLRNNPAIIRFAIIPQRKWPPAMKQAARMKWLIRINGRLGQSKRPNKSLS